MRPDQAMSKVAYEAVDLLDQYKAQGGTGDPQQLINCLNASVAALALVATMYEGEIAEPGYLDRLDPTESAFVLGEAHAAAAGVLLVCSLLPGVDSLVPPVAH